MPTSASAAFVAGAAAVLLSCLLPSLVSAQTTGSWSLVSFCYVSYNSLATSPFLLWSFSTQGTLNVSIASAGLALVTDARGIRQAYYAGDAVDSTNITGVAAPGSYLGNSNLLSTSNASLPLSASAILVFVSAAPAPFATGLRVSAAYPSGLPYIAVSSSGELDNPPNDGETSLVTTLWQTAAATDGLSAEYSGCTLTLPIGLVNSPAAVSLYQSNSSATQFCFDISGGPGEGTTNGAAWNVLASGLAQTSGWVGTTVSGRSASMLTALSGTRSFVYQNGSSVTASISLAPFTAASAAINASLAASRAGVANNVLYDGWPQLDEYGWALQSSADITVQALAHTQTAVSRLSINSTGELIETVLAAVNSTVILSRTGTFLTQPDNGSSSSNLSALTAQCSIDYGAVAQYEFCYFIDQSALPVSSPQHGIVYAYGLVTAAGPQPQRGRQALRVLKLTGVRYVQNVSATVSQNLKHIKYIDQDISLNQPTDDLIFTSAPALDQQGLLIETNGNALFFSGLSGNTDVRLQQGQYGISELDSDGVSRTLASNATLSGFYYQSVPAAGLSVTTQCSAYSSLFSANGSPAPAVTTYSFCYSQSNPSYNVSVAASLQLYSTPISFLGRIGYAIAGMNGSRSFTSSSGSGSLNGILGPSSDWFAKQINPAESYDQLVSLSNASQLVDAQGLLYQVQGQIQTPLGANYNLQVIRLYWNATAAAYTEEVEVGPGQFSELLVTRVALLTDGGASAAAGTVLSIGCAAVSPPVSVFSPSSSSSSSSPSPSSSSSSFASSPSPSSIPSLHSTSSSSSSTAGRLTVGAATVGRSGGFAWSLSLALVVLSTLLFQLS